MEEYTGYLIIFGVVVLIIMIMRNDAKQKKQRQELEEREVEELKSKLNDHITDFAQNGISPIESDIKLAKNENLFALLKAVEWQEYRKVRTGRVSGHGITGRIKIAKGVYYRYGTGRMKSESVDALQTLDVGDLYVTDKKIFFRGDFGNKSLSYEKIININPAMNGIEIEKMTGKNVFIPYNFKNNSSELARILICNRKADEE